MIIQVTNFLLCVTAHYFARMILVKTQNKTKRCKKPKQQKIILKELLTSYFDKFGIKTKGSYPSSHGILFHKGNSFEFKQGYMYRKNIKIINLDKLPALVVPINGDVNIYKCSIGTHFLLKRHIMSGLATRD